MPPFVGFASRFALLWLRRHPTKAKAATKTKETRSYRQRKIKKVKSSLLRTSRIGRPMKMVKKEQKVKFKKAPFAPKRFKSAFMFYSEQQHKSIRSQNAPGNKKVRHSFCVVLG